MDKLGVTVCEVKGEESERNLAQAFPAPGEGRPGRFNHECIHFRHNQQSH